MLSLAIKLYKAFKNSWKGLKYAYHSEWTIRLVFIELIIAIPLAFYISQHLMERIVMISSVLFLLMVELMNTAIETTINRISLDHHELSGLAKDIASAAMLIAVINAVVIWGMILFNKII